MATALFTSALALAEDQPSESSAQEGEGVQASPDVQAQVGVGTEKEQTRDKQEQTREAPPTPFDPTTGAQEEDLGHGMQFGFRPGLVVPYKVMFRFDESPKCDLDTDGEDDLNNDGDDAKACGFLMPLQVELAASFAPLDGVEPYVWLRLGLGEELETGTESALLFGAGVRLYTMSTSKLKLFFDVAAGMEVEGAIDPTDEATQNYESQVFGRLGFGPQFDLNRYVGAFLVLGPGFAVPRGITMQIEGLVGLQGRVPLRCRDGTVATVSSARPAAGGPGFTPARWTARAVGKPARAARHGSLPKRNRERRRDHPDAGPGSGRGGARPDAAGGCGEKTRRARARPASHRDLGERFARRGGVVVGPRRSLCTRRYTPGRRGPRRLLHSPTP
jgi:hypothetical protein